MENFLRLIVIGGLISLFALARHCAKETPQPDNTSRIEASSDVRIKIPVLKVSILGDNSFDNQIRDIKPGQYKIYLLYYYKTSMSRVTSNTPVIYTVTFLKNHHYKVSGFHTYSSVYFKVEDVTTGKIVAGGFK